VLVPKKLFIRPVVLQHPAPKPKKLLPSPVVLWYPAPGPKKLLSTPEVLLNPALQPKKLFPHAPAERLAPAPHPAIKFAEVPAGGCVVLQDQMLLQESAEKTPPPPPPVALIVPSKAIVTPEPAFTAPILPLTGGTIS
jgi:hypothetical protein